MPVDNNDIIENIRKNMEDVGYTPGDSASFKEAMRNEQNRNRLYDNLSKDPDFQFDLGSKDEWNNAFKSQYSLDVLKGYRAPMPGDKWVINGKTVEPKKAQSAQSEKTQSAQQPKEAPKPAPATDWNKDWGVKPLEMPQVGMGTAGLETWDALSSGRVPVVGEGGRINGGERFDYDPLWLQKQYDPSNKLSGTNQEVIDSAVGNYVSSVMNELHGGAKHTNVDEEKLMKDIQANTDNINAGPIGEYIANKQADANDDIMSNIIKDNMEELKGLQNGQQVTPENAPGLFKEFSTFINGYSKQNQDISSRRFGYLLNNQLSANNINFGSTPNAQLWNSPGQQPLGTKTPLEMAESVAGEKINPKDMPVFNPNTGVWYGNTDKGQAIANDKNTQMAVDQYNDKNIEDIANDAIFELQKKKMAPKVYKDANGNIIEVNTSGHSGALTGEGQMTPDDYYEAIFNQNTINKLQNEWFKSIDPNNPSKSKFSDSVIKGARELGIMPQEFVERSMTSLTSRLEKYLSDTLQDKAAVKNTMDYIVKNFLTNSLTGQIFMSLTGMGKKSKHGLQTEAGLIASEVAKSDEGQGKYYNPSTVTKGVATATTFAEPLFGASGKVVSKSAGVLMRGGVEATSKLDRIGIWTGKAIQGDSSYLAMLGKTSRTASNLVGGSLRGAVAMGGYMGAQSGLSAYNNGEDGIGIWNATADGIAEGAKMGGVFPLLEFPGNKLLGRMKSATSFKPDAKLGEKVRKITARIGTGGASALIGIGVFDAYDGLSAALDGKYKDFSWTDNAPNAAKMYFAGKVANPMGTLRGIKDFFRSNVRQDGIYLSKDEKQEVYNYLGIKNESGITLDGLIKVLGAKGDITNATRQKLSLLTSHSCEPTSYRTYNSTVFGTTEKGEVQEKAKDGTLIRRHKYNSEEEYRKIMSDIQNRKANYDLAEKMGQFRLFVNSPELIQGNFAETATQVASDHGFVGDNSPEDANIIREMTTPGTKLNQEYMEAAFDKVTTDMAASHDMSFEDMMKIMKKSPTDWTPLERSLIHELGESFEAAIPKDGKLSTEREKVTGANKADEVGAGTVDENPEAVSQASAEISQAVEDAKKAWNEYSKTEDGENVAGQMNAYAQQGVDPMSDEMYNYLSQNFTEEQLAPLANLLNAQARQRAFLDKTAANIDEQVSRVAQNVVLHGSVEGADGQKSGEGSVVYVTDGQYRYVLTGGDVKVGENGRIVSTGDGPDTVTLRRVDENGILADGEGVYIRRPSDLSYESMESVDDLSKRLGEQIGQATTANIAAGAQGVTPAEGENGTEGKQPTTPPIGGEGQNGTEGTTKPRYEINQEAFGKLDPENDSITINSIKNTIDYLNGKIDAKTLYEKNGWQSSKDWEPTEENYKKIADQEVEDYKDYIKDNGVEAAKPKTPVTPPTDGGENGGENGGKKKPITQEEAETTLKNWTQLIDGYNQQIKDGTFKNDKALSQIAQVNRNGYISQLEEQIKNMPEGAERENLERTLAGLKKINEVVSRMENEGKPFGTDEGPNPPQPEGEGPKDNGTPPPPPVIGGGEEGEKPKDNIPRDKKGNGLYHQMEPTVENLDAAIDDIKKRPDLSKLGRKGNNDPNAFADRKIKQAEDELSKLDKDYAKAIDEFQNGEPSDETIDEASEFLTRQENGTLSEFKPKTKYGKYLLASADATARKDFYNQLKNRLLARSTEETAKKVNQTLIDWGTKLTEIQKGVMDGTYTKEDADKAQKERKAYLDKVQQQYDSMPDGEAKEDLGKQLEGVRNLDKIMTEAESKIKTKPTFDFKEGDMVKGKTGEVYKIKGINEEDGTYIAEDRQGNEVQLDVDGLEKFEAPKVDFKKGDTLQDEKGNIYKFLNDNGDGTISVEDKDGNHISIDFDGLKKYIAPKPKYDWQSLSEDKLDDSVIQGTEANWDKAKGLLEENPQMKREELQRKLQIGYNQATLLLRRWEAEHNEVPDVVNDKPEDARKRGYRLVNGVRVDRPTETEGVTGGDGEVRFSNDDKVKSKFKVIDADDLQPSHTNGQRNRKFFIDEAQPKNRVDDVSIAAAMEMAKNIDPQQITGDGGAYTDSAPTVNKRGEVVQGNNRAAALKYMYGGSANKESQDRYKQYILDHAKEYGFTDEQIEAIKKMEHPILVNEIDVSDKDAIRLGQMTSTDLETGGIQRIKASETATKLGTKGMVRFAVNLVSNPDEDMSLSDLISKNGRKALELLFMNGAINKTQYQSAFRKDGSLTPEAREDLQNLLESSLVKGGPSDLPTMFDGLPAKIQKGILTTFMLDGQSAEKDRILPEIQKAIEAYYECNEETGGSLKAAKDYKKAKAVIDDWCNSPKMDSKWVSPKKRYSNFALELAARMQSMKMKDIQGNFKNLFNAIQGKTNDFFKKRQPPMSKFDAIKQEFGIDYKPLESKPEGSGTDYVKVFKEAKQKVYKWLVGTMRKAGIKIISSNEAMDKKFWSQWEDDSGTDEGDLKFSIRKKAAPKKTQKVYKLMRLGEDGKLYPLFIDSAEGIEVGKWYDADSPDLSVMKKLDSGVWLIDPKNGTATSLEDYNNSHNKKSGKNPTKDAINEAANNGQRWVRIVDKGKAQKRYGGETRSYYNIGINGSGGVSDFAMRPGWHAGSLPSMHQIGKGKNKDLRDNSFVWVEGEVPADVDYNAEAQANVDKDIPDHIPTDGYYLKSTNANSKAAQADRMGWYVAGAFKADRIISDAEARKVIDDWNATHQDKKVEYDWKRESGEDFDGNVEEYTKKLYQKQNTAKRVVELANNFMRVFHGSGADFDKFDTRHHVGEGEGSHVFGWGTYVADQKDLAKKYAEIAYNTNQVTLAVEDGKPFDYNNPKFGEYYKFIACDKLAKWGKEEALKALQQDIKDCEQLGWNDHKANYQKAYDYLKNHKVEIPNKNQRVVYEVDIPKDNGKNYLDWDGKLTREQAETIKSKLYDYILANDVDKMYDSPQAKEELKKDLDHIKEGDTFSDIYGDISLYLGTDRMASKFLNKIGYTGIKVQAAHNSGDERYKDNWNYVVFDDKDLHIANKYKFLQIGDGEIYGFVDMKTKEMYLDPDHMDPNVPIHEYGHLWLDGIRRSDPKTYKNIMSLIDEKDPELKPLFDEVREDDPELDGEDLKEEVLMRYSGKRGEDKLNEKIKEIQESDKSAEAKSIAEKAIEKVRTAVHTFWAKVADKLGIKYNDISEVADHMLGDLLEGKNPNEKKAPVPDEPVAREIYEKTDAYTEADRKLTEALVNSKDGHVDDAIYQAWKKAQNDLTEAFRKVAPERLDKLVEGEEEEHWFSSLDYRAKDVAYKVAGENIDNREKSEAFEESAKESGEIVPTEPTKKKATPKDFMGGKKDHKVYQLLYHDNGYVVATDGHIIFAEKQKYDKSLEGKATDKKGGVVDSEFPRWRSVIPKEEEMKSAGIDINDLHKFVAGVLARKGSDENTKITFKDSDGNILTYRAKYLDKILRAAKALNGDLKVCVSETNTRPLVVSTDKGVSLIMPIQADGDAVRNSWVYVPKKAPEPPKESTKKPSIADLTPDEESTFTPEQKKSFAAEFKKAVDNVGKFSRKHLENQIRNGLDSLRYTTDKAQRLRAEHLVKIFQAEQQARKDFAKKYGIKDGETTIDNVKRMFDEWNGDKELTKVFEQVMKVSRLFGNKIKFTYRLTSAMGNAGTEGLIKYNTADFTASGYTNQEKAGCLLHELGHHATMYAMVAYEYRNDTRRDSHGLSGQDIWNKLTDGQKKAVENIYNIYHEIKNDKKDFPGGFSSRGWVGEGKGKQYGLTNAYEMVAEMIGNTKFRAMAKAKNLWTKLKDAIKSFFTSDMEGADKTNVKKAVWKEIDYLLEHPNVEVYDAVKNHFHKRSSLFIGKEGAERLDDIERGERITNLEYARVMEKAGMDDATIKLATGWERGADKKWRYEVMDPSYVDLGPKTRYETLQTKYNEVKTSSPSAFKKLRRYENLPDMSDRQWDNYESLVKDLGLDKYGYWDEYMLKDGKSTSKLSDVLKGKYAEDLFNAYPEMKDIKVEYDNLGSMTLGYWDIDKNTIELSTRSTREQQSQTILHEIQHAIQDKEGFATGSNPSMFTDPDRKDRAYGILDREIKKFFGNDDLSTIEGVLNKSIKGYDDFVKKLQESAYDIYIKDLKEDYDKEPDKHQFILDYDKHVKKYNRGYASEQYNHTSGEVEARNVEARKKMSEEERRNSNAWQTEDVSREDQIFLYGSNRSESRLNSEDKDKSSKDLFVSLKDKKDKDYDETIDILSERAADGRATIRRLSPEAKSEAPSKVQSAIEIIASDKGRVQGTDEVRSGNDAARHETERAVEEWAKKNNAWYNEDEVTKDSYDGKRYSSGSESNVYLSKDGKTITKFIDPYVRNGRGLASLMEDVSVFNTLFPESAYKVIGVARGDKDTRFKVVLEQPRIEGTQQSLFQYMRNGMDVVKKYFEERGFTPQEDGVSFSNGKYFVNDIHYGNVIFDKEGEPHIIDADAKYNVQYAKNAFGDRLDIEDIHESKSEQAMMRVDPSGKMSEDKRKSEGQPRSVVLDKVVEVTDNLNLNGTRKVNIEYGTENMPENVRQSVKRGENVTGWYDPKDGSAHLYMPNIHDAYTAERTILHEVVGHKGLRELLGDKGYAAFMRKLYIDNVGGVADYVKENAYKYGYDLYKTIDEYLAEEAEKFGNDDRSLMQRAWDKVTDLLNAGLNKLGFNTKLTERDVRRVLWESKNRIKEGDAEDAIKHNSFLDRLSKTDVSATSFEGKTYDESVKRDENGYLSPEAMMRVADTNVHEDDTMPEQSAKEYYHHALSRMGYVWSEAHSDRMQALRELMKAYTHGKIDDVPGFENPIWAENRASSKLSIQVENFKRNYAKPLEKVVAVAMKAFPASGSHKNLQRRRALQVYLLKKSGLEKNRVYFVRDFLNKEKAKNVTEKDLLTAEKAEFDKRMAQNKTDLANGNIDQSQYDFRANMTAKAVRREAMNQLQKDFDAKRAELKTKYIDGGQRRYDEFYKGLDEWINYNIDLYDAGENDYCGFREMEGKGFKDSYDDAAEIAEVMATESQMENHKKGIVDDLWEQINKVAKFSLDTEYNAGLISKDVYDRTTTMLDWYVPHRGFDQEVAEDHIDYFDGSGKAFSGPALMKAVGRYSSADLEGPLAYLCSQASTSMQRAVKNEVMQAFGRFIDNHYEKDNPDRLVTKTDTWIVRKMVGGQEVWEEEFPPIDDNTPTDQIPSVISNWEAQMKALAENGNAYRSKNFPHFPYKFRKRTDKDSHTIVVYNNGVKETYVIQGHPRAAQALNGETKDDRPNNMIIRAVNDLTNYWKRLVTTFSPNFIGSNLSKDADQGGSYILARESLNYYRKYVGAWWKLFGGKMTFNVFQRKYKKGTLDMSNKDERLYKEFCDNGGMTGFYQSQTLDDWKNEINDQLDLLTGKGGKVLRVAKAINPISILSKGVDVINKNIENIARFATYKVSREMGRSVAKSILDAKNVSTNFNKQGSYGKAANFDPHATGVRKLNQQLAGGTAQTFRLLIPFYNAGIQSLKLLANNIKEHPVKTIGTTIGGHFAIALAMPFINSWLQSFFDDNDEYRKVVTYDENGNPHEEQVKVDHYAELPDYVRRQNFCFYVGNGRFVTFPIGIENRAFYGMGDLVAGLISQLSDNKFYSGYNDPTEDKVLSSMGLISQTLPTDFVGASNGVGLESTFMPAVLQPIYEVKVNKDWLGRPIKQDRYSDDNRPNWQLANRDTNGAFIDLAKYMTRRANPYNDENIKSQAWYGDPDPAAWQHLLKGWSGGFGQTISEIAGLCDEIAALPEDEKTSQKVSDIAFSNNMPILRRFNKKDPYGETRQKYYNYRSIVSSAQATIKELAEKGETDPIAKMQSVSAEEGRKGKMVLVWSNYSSYIKDLTKKINASTDPKQRKQLMDQRDQIMYMAVHALDNIK